jgi:PAS domain-containing protein
LEVLAGLITYTNPEGQQKYAILMRDDDSEHQALREFAMAHELGHWCAHIKGKQPAERKEQEFYLNSLHDLGQFEDEANKVALITLFPTSYLALCEVKKTLTAEKVFADYIEGMRDTETRDPEGQLKTNMMGFLRMRIGNYQKYRHTWLQRMELLDRPLTRPFVRSLASYIGEDFAWAELNGQYIVIDSNQKFAALVGLSKEQLLRKEIDVRELSEPGSRHITSEQLAAKREDKTPKFYVTRYKNLRTQEIIPVTIYALPIVENNEYSGSFGIVTAINGKSGASH